MIEPFISTHLLKAKQTLALGDGSTLFLFEVYDLKFATMDDPYRDILEFFWKTGPNRNIYRAKDEQVIWRVSDHRWKNNEAADPFDFVFFQNGRWIGRTANGFEYAIELSSGEVSKIGWTKM